MCQHKQWEEEHKDATQPELEVTAKTNWPEYIEAVEEWLKGCLGVTGMPLAYVVRPNTEVIPEANDPPTNYATKQDKLIARAPHNITDAAGNTTLHPTQSSTKTNTPSSPISPCTDMQSLMSDRRSGTS